MISLMKCINLFIISISPLYAQGITGKDILKKIDNNMVLQQAVTNAKMVIHARTGTRTIESKSWVDGTDKAFVEYLNPPRERGKKMLRLDDNIWNYIPEPTDRIITISGHLLKQSVMGSDLSYEDMTDNSELVEDYDVKIVGKDTVDTKQCYVLELTAVNDEVTYYARKIWVDEDIWLPIVTELYAKSGKLLKRIQIDETFKIGDRWYPRKMTFKDVLSKGKGTEYHIEKIDFDVSIPAHKFTKAALRK